MQPTRTEDTCTRTNSKPQSLSMREEKIRERAADEGHKTANTASIEGDGKGTRAERSGHMDPKMGHYCRKAVNNTTLYVANC